MKVVMLLGSSSAGKSTSCNELKKNPQWHIISGDETVVKINNEASTDLNQFVIKNTKLNKYMTDKEIEAVCFTGMLNISQGAHRVTDFQFSSLDFKEAEDCLKAAGFDSLELNELVEGLRATGVFFGKYPHADLTERLLDQAFDSALNDDDSCQGFSTSLILLF